MLEGRGSRPKGYIDEKWNFKLYIYISRLKSEKGTSWKGTIKF
jgi:hypothetical protein